MLAILSLARKDPGNLTDLKDEVFWRSGEGGTALDATDTHSVPADPIFALKTTSGGALVFYTTAAQLTLTPPAEAPSALSPSPATIRRLRRQG